MGRKEREAQAAQGEKIDDRVTRPERRFEARRVVWIVFLLIPLGCIGFLVMRGCLSPMSGVDSLGGSRRTPTAVSVAVLGSTVVAPSPVPSVGARGSLPCYMLADVVFDGGVLPVSGRVLVSGYTFARGGRVLVSDPNAGWIDAGYVRCDGDISLLERSYFVTPTASLFPTLTPTVERATLTPLRVYVNLPTHTPYPTYTPFPVVSASGLGVYRESVDCWYFDVSGVREIWINGGTPVAGGSVHCGIENFKVVVR